MLLPIALLVATAEPATAAPSPAPSVSRPAMSLQSTLQIEKQGRQFTFTVTVHNAAREPKELQFTDAGRLQVVVTGPDGTQLYDSRAGRMFAQVIGSVTVAPAKDVTFQERWTAPEGVTGTATVCARVRSNPPLTAAGTVELGPG